MVGYPSNAPRPVLAFVGPADPQAAARAAQAASRALEDIWNKTKPRKLAKGAVGRLFVLRPIADCVVGFVLPQIPGIHEPSCFGVPMMVGGESTNEFVVPSGWTLVTDCFRSVDEPFESHAACSNGNQSFTLSQRKFSYALFGDRYSSWFQNNGLNGLGTPGDPAYWWRTAKRFRHPDANITTFPHYEQGVNYSYMTRTRLKPDTTQTGAGRWHRPRPPALTSNRQPPRKGEKEAPKQRWTAGAFPFRKLLEQLLETHDAVEAIHDALPDRLKCSNRTTACMASAVLGNLEAVDWGTAVENLIDEKLEDIFFGMFGRMTAAEARATGRARGIQARPATRHGGWSPCVFCN